MSLLDLLAGSMGAGQERHDGRIYGVVIGVVTNNQDPDKLGRVKLRFPWLAEDTESAWARVVTFMAGKGRGAFFLPEVDDEVLVAFEHGDVSVPYVLGGVWNGVDTPFQDNADGKNALRVIKSRSGHELIFNDDGDGQKEQVQLHTKAGHQIILDDAAGKEKITIQDKTGSNKIEIDSNQNSIAIEGQMKISLKAQTIEIESGTTMTIKAGATLTIKGTLVQIN